MGLRWLLRSLVYSIVWSESIGALCDRAIPWFVLQPPVRGLWLAYCSSSVCVQECIGFTAYNRVVLWAWEHRNRARMA